MVFSTCSQPSILCLGQPDLELPGSEIEMDNKWPNTKDNLNLDLDDLFSLKEFLDYIGNQDSETVHALLSLFNLETPHLNTNTNLELRISSLVSLLKELLKIKSHD